MVQPSGALGVFSYTFYFELVVDLYSVKKNNTKISHAFFMQFFPMGTSYPELLYLRIFVLFFSFIHSGESSQIYSEGTEKTEHF